MPDKPAPAEGNGPDRRRDSVRRTFFWRFEVRAWMRDEVAARRDGDRPGSGGNENGSRPAEHAGQLGADRQDRI